MAKTIRAPDGKTWVVRRHWTPRLGVESLWGRFCRRFRWGVRRADDTAHLDLGWSELFGEGIAAVATFILVLLFLVFVAFPLLAAVIEVAFVVLLAAAAVIARVLLRRPWTIEALASDGTTREWRVPGWRASGERRTEIERQLAVTGVLPPLDGTAAFRL